MLIAHIASAYIYMTALKRSRWVQPDGIPAEAQFAAYVGSIFPDLDLLYYFTVDHHRHLHHSYWTHWPLVWVALSALVMPPVLAWGNRTMRWAAGLFLVSGFFHLVLDSVVGEIYWGAPFFHQRFSFFTVHPHFSPWYWNFIFHWSFLLELAITVIAWQMYRANRAVSSTVNPDF